MVTISHMVSKLIDGNIYDRKGGRLGAGKNRTRNAAETRCVETEAKREGKTGKEVPVLQPVQSGQPPGHVAVGLDAGSPE